MVHFYRSTAPRALVLASVCTLCYISWEMSNVSITGMVIMHCFSFLNAVSYDSPHIKLASFHINAGKGSAILLNLLKNFRKNYTKPRKDCNYYIVVGLGHSLRLFTLASLIFRPSRVMLNPRKVVVLCRKLHFFSLQ